MKRSVFFLFILTVLSSCHFTTGSGNIISETRVTGNFTGISAAGGFNVEVKTGPVTEVIVESDDNIIKYIETEVSGNILKIRLRDHINVSNAHLKVYVTASGISNIAASAGSDVVVKDVLKSENTLHFTASSAGTIISEIEAPEVEAGASSGAKLQLTGKTRNFTAIASSGANIKTRDLFSENTVVSASSGSNIYVHASVSLQAKASSGADIKYHGAANVQKTVSSGGSVEKKD